MAGRRNEAGSRERLLGRTELRRAVVVVATKDSNILDSFLPIPCTVTLWVKHLSLFSVIDGWK